MTPSPLKPQAGTARLAHGEADAQGAAAGADALRLAAYGTWLTDAGLQVGDGRVVYRSSGVRPLCLAIRASILGPISSWS